MNVRRFLRLLGRTTLPRHWAIVWVAFFVCLDAAAYWLQVLAAPERERYILLRDGFLVAAAAVYGFARVVAFHPVFRADYRGWLATTPWQRGKPLPLGPIHLVWQDVLVVGVMCVAQHNAVVDRALLPTAFFLGYHIGMTICCWAAAEILWAYVLAFATAFAIRLLVFPPYALAIAAVLYTASFAALRATLGRFPWEETAERLELLRLATVKQEDAGLRRDAFFTSEMMVRDRVDARLGWPFGVLDTHDPGVQVSRRDGLLLGLLIGWWVYAVMVIVPEEAGLSLASLLGTALLAIGVIGRLAVYCAHYNSPISFWGRIVTFRWIIPGYDRVFVGPLAALLAGIAIPAGRFYADLPPTLYLPATLTFVLSILLTSRPSLREWRTTGNHRIVPGPSRKHRFIEH